MKTAASLLVASVGVAGHGHMVVPPSRNGGNLHTGGSCAETGQCFWFSNNVEIPGPITLPEQHRTANRPATQGSVEDVYKTAPWRAPGSAPVFGSGCGKAGGGDTYYANGGHPPKGVTQGFDGSDLPATPLANWTRGETAEVAWAISANHGGGYGYRLCPKSANNVTEACFQSNPLPFAGTDSWIVQTDGSRSAPFKRVDVTEGVHPKNSAWAKSPVPGCYICNPYETCGAPLPPQAGKGGGAWEVQVGCNAQCDGGGASKANGACPDGTPNYPEVSPGISGFGKYDWSWSVMDLVQVPKELAAGEYLLSWRWDCEESTQVWQNCADIQLN